MITADIRHFERDHGLVVVKLADPHVPELALRVCGSDRSTLARLGPGETIQFDIACDRRGHPVAFDISAIRAGARI